MYDGLSEKDKDFQCSTINTIEELKQFISCQDAYKPPIIERNFGNISLKTTDFLSSRKHYIIYRGVKESKFYLKTSLQVRWKEIEHFHPSCTPKEYLSKMVMLLSSNKEIKEYLIKDGKSYSCISILALMQHYGIPTPLLDWTPNIKIGLNFAYDGIDLSPSDDEISNYVSLYFINLWENHELTDASYQAILADCYERLFRLDLNDVEDLSEVTLQNIFNIDDINKDFFLIDYSEDAPKVRDLLQNVLSLINPNLEKQEGAFIINFQPDNLDYYWNKKMSDHETIAEIPYVDSANGLENHTAITENPNAKGIIPKTKINCVNIKKIILKEWIENGGMQDHYNEEEQSQKLKRNVLETYYTWLLEGNKDLEFFKETFVKNVETEGQIAQEIINKYSGS